MMRAFIVDPLPLRRFSARASFNPLGGLLERKTPAAAINWFVPLGHVAELAQSLLLMSETGFTASPETVNPSRGIPLRSRF